MSGDYSAAELQLLKESFGAGGLVGHGLSTYNFYLRRFNEMSARVCATQSSIDAFRLDIEILRSALPDETLKSTIVRKDSRIDRAVIDLEESQLVLETLGSCGILESKEHPGFLDACTSPNTAPRKSHRSHWEYPADFWTGSDGVSGEAVDFWFGSLEELKACGDH